MAKAAPRRLQPGASLCGIRGIVVQTDPFVRDAHVLFKNGGPFSDGHLHAVQLVGGFVGGIPDPDLRVSRLQQVDLVQLQLRGGGRVLRDAVHDGEVLLSVFQEAHHLVDILQGNARRGGDDRLVGFGDPLQERPIQERTARDLDDIEIVFLDEIDGGFIEGGCTWP